MKKLFTVLTLTAMTSYANATCTQDELTGRWGGSLGSSGFGIPSACVLNVAPDGTISSGACYDSTTFQKTPITSGTASVNVNCIATFTFELQSNITVTAKALLSGSGETAAGTYNDSTEDTGPFTFVKSGES